MTDRIVIKKTIPQQSDEDGIDESERQREAARVTLGLNESTGMGEIRGELHPDDWQQINRRVDAEVVALRQHDEHRGKNRAQLSALALVTLICGPAMTSVGPARVAIHVPLDVFLPDGALDASSGPDIVDEPKSLNRRVA